MYLLLVNPESSNPQFYNYNNAGVDTKDTLGLFYNTTGLVYYISNYPLIAVAKKETNNINETVVRSTFKV